MMQCIKEVHARPEDRRPTLPHTRPLHRRSKQDNALPEHTFNVARSQAQTWPPPIVVTTTQCTASGNGCGWPGFFSKALLGRLPRGKRGGSLTSLRTSHNPWYDIPATPAPVPFHKFQVQSRLAVGLEHCSKALAVLNLK